MDEQPRKGKDRSPNFPGVSLERAIDLAEKFRSHEGRNPAPYSTALTDMGYSKNSGAGQVALSAVRKFGLLDEVGSGAAKMVKLSDLAVRILLDKREPSPERESAIKEAALRPAIYQELISQYPQELPSDSTLDHELRVKRKFTDSAAAEFIRHFRATVEYAKLLPYGKPDDDQADKGAGMLSGAQQQQTHRTAPPGQAVLWRQEGNIGSGLTFEWRIVGQEGRQITPSEVERLKKYLDLQVEGLEDEARATEGEGAS